MLKGFWGEAKMMAWSELFSREEITESPKNLICLNRQLHFWFDHAKFALKPLRQTENEVVVQWHWLKDARLKPKDRITGDDFLTQAGLTDQNWGKGLAHRKSGMPVRTGQIFHIRADDPEHLPSFELLELQWNLLRVAAISGAADVSKDYWWSDDSEDEGHDLWEQNEQEDWQGEDEGMERWQGEDQDLERWQLEDQDMERWQQEDQDPEDKPSA